MQNRDKTTFEERNILCDYFKSNLEDIQIPVDRKCWDGISRRLSKKKKIRLFKTYVTSIAATALITISICKLDSYFSEKKYEKASFEVVPQKEQSLQNAQKTAKTGQPDNYRKTIDKISIKSVVNYQNNAFTAEELPVKEEISTENQPETKNKPDEKYLTSVDNEQTCFAEEDPKSDKRNGKWGICASIGATEALSENQIRNFDAVGNDGFPERVHKNATGDSYSAPFSIGVILSKKLSEKVSIESGLVYSYLSTTYRLHSHFAQRTLKLHYIGIPLKITATISQLTPSCKIYISGGAMAEKGIVSYLSYESRLSGAHITEKSSIDGVQWSLSTSAGLSHNLFKNWDIYLEPHITYYFNNNQPLSIRTVQKTIASINTGLRYEF